MLANRHELCYVTGAFGPVAYAATVGTNPA